MKNLQIIAVATAIILFFSGFYYGKINRTEEGGYSSGFSHSLPMGYCDNEEAIDSAGFEIIDATNFYLKIQQYPTCIILDASTYKEYRKKRIEGASSIAKSVMIDTVLKSKDKETNIMVYCTHGDRSKAACKKICGKGFKNVYELEGGIHDWEEAGYPLDKTKIKKRKKKN